MRVREPRPPTPRTGERGMTLAELLVALTLLGMLSVMMMGGLRFGARAWERTEESSGHMNAVVRTHAFLRARLSETTRPDAVTGEADRLTFSALWLTALGAANLYEFELFHRDGEALVLAWRPMPDEDAAPEELSGERTLLEGVTGLEIAYFGQPPGYPAADWLDRWEPDWPAPLLVRIEAELAHPRRDWPTLTVGLPG
ncbi:MAG TPA: prepilin-type N-terminal cleavage/methylation domain-containing protein [Thermohalobaculum sp.]|nr:prepilin-type N-terminal cleavage/methylation domain-containing protein [Thermohalobaculum sp.]